MDGGGLFWFCEWARSFWAKLDDCVLCWTGGAAVARGADVTRRLLLLLFRLLDDQLFLASASDTNTARIASPSTTAEAARRFRSASMFHCQTQNNN